MRKRVLCTQGNLRWLQRRRDRLYMRKIERINQSPDVCWAELVGWHYTAVNNRGPRLKPISRSCDAGDCRTNLIDNAACWCGKFVTAAVVAEFPEFGRTGIIVEAAQ